MICYKLCAVCLVSVSKWAKFFKRFCSKFVDPNIWENIQKLLCANSKTQTQIVLPLHFFKKLIIKPLCLTVVGCHNGLNGNGGATCCTSTNQCSEGEGDCDTDADCSGNLKCGQGNGFDDNCDTTLGFPSTHDCCYDPNKGKHLSQLL